MSELLSFPTCRSGLSHLEEQSQNLKESFEKRFCELKGFGEGQNSLEKGKISDTSRKKPTHADKNESIAEKYMYIIV